MRIYYTCLLFYFSFSLGLQGQIPSMDNLDIKEFTFFYKDSIKNEVTFGNYEPTGILSTNDNSLIVSTQFSISFPNQYNTPDQHKIVASEAYTKEYFEEQKIYEQKSHISSGSIFKLNSQRKKIWETFFKEKRVVRIKLLSDSTILAVGEDVSMNFFWMAKLNQEGQILLEKQYKFKRRPNIENIETDSLNNVYLLLSTERLKPVFISKIYGKRKLHFFKETENESDLYLVKISSNGKIKWKKAIDNRKNYRAYGYDLLFFNKDIYITSQYEGFEKRKGVENIDKGRILYRLNRNGNIIEKSQIENKRLLLIDNQLYLTSFEHKDSLVIYKYVQNIDLPFKTILLRDIKKSWIEKALSGKEFNYILGTHHNNLGCLLIELNKQSQAIGYWKNSENNFPSFVDAILTRDNSVIIVAREYSKLNKEMNKSVYSVKIYEIEKD